MNKPLLLMRILAVFFLVTLPANVYAMTPDQVFEKVKDSVVVVKTINAQGKLKSLGSGVLITSGRVITNCHVLDGGASWQIGRGKTFVEAGLYAEDRDKDICLLDARDMTGKPAQLGATANLKVGNPVYTVGAPQGLELSLSDGIISQLRGGTPPMIQTTAAISSGSSGGGLFDSEGRLVGLTTFYVKDGQSLNFAMPVELIGGVKPGRKIAAPGQKQLDWKKRILDLQDLQDWQGLRDWCRQWTEKEPDKAEAWHCLGAAYFRLKLYAAAANDFQRAARINSEYAEAWHGVGIAYINQGRSDDAINPLRRAVHIKPDHIDAWSDLGVAYIRLERYEPAIDAFREAIHINPKDEKSWYGVGLAYAGLKRFLDATAALREALRINPEYTEAWKISAYAYINTGNRQAAINALRELHRLDPEKADKVSKQTGLRLP